MGCLRCPPLLHRPASVPTILQSAAAHKWSDAPRFAPTPSASPPPLRQDLGRRLLPAFNTPTGLPVAWINLARGVEAGEGRTTCTAAAGTLLLEMTLLSRLSGDPAFEAAAAAAATALHLRRSLLGLPGTMISVDDGTWQSPRSSSVGAGVDSYHEYLLKEYLLTGNETWLDLFLTSYHAVMTYCSEAGSPVGGLLLEVRDDG